MHVSCTGWHEWLELPELNLLQRFHLFVLGREDWNGTGLGHVEDDHYASGTGSFGWQEWPAVVSSALIGSTW